MDRFASLVDTPEGKEAFKTRYDIPPGVNIQHFLLGEWHTLRPKGAVVIPMIAFIEGGMQILVGKVTRDFLIAHKLYSTQCSPNLFRILGSVDALNQKMGVNLSHHDVNWVYNCQYLKDTGYYLKTRVPSVRLILCLLESNKGLDQDFLIVLGEWHDALHYLMWDGQLSGVF